MTSSSPSSKPIIIFPSSKQKARTTSTISSRTTTISSPGKALIAGGYLVLEKPNPGIVIATDSCFYSTISVQPVYYNEVEEEDEEDEDDEDDDKDWNCLRLEHDNDKEENEEEEKDKEQNDNNETLSFPLDVYSPQFHQVYTYAVYIHTSSIMNKSDDHQHHYYNHNDDLKLISLQSRRRRRGRGRGRQQRQRKQRPQSKNIFIEKTILLSLSSILIAQLSSTTSTSSLIELATYLSSLSSSKNKDKKQLALAIKLRADNDFYSIIPHLKTYNIKPIPSVMDHTLPPFLSCPKTKKEKEVVVTLSSNTEVEQGHHHHNRHQQQHQHQQQREKEEEEDATTTKKEKEKEKEKRIMKEETIVEINKTGLGSSAALVTSLVGSLLVHFDIVSIMSNNNNGNDNDYDENDNNNSGYNNNPNSNSNSNSNIIINNHKQGMKVIHNLAQICHSFAQGKIGSGFDVSAAVYGSHVYTRFDKDIIEPIMNCLSHDLQQEETPASAAVIMDTTSSKSVSSIMSLSLQTSQELWKCTIDQNNIWNAQIDPLVLPSNVEILMADICGGSESPSMAKKVLKWKNDKEGGVGGRVGKIQWMELMKINLELKKLFMDIYNSNLIKEEREEEEEEEEEFIQEIREKIIASRKQLKSMGEDANVPIEPNEQTELANDTMKHIPGVIAAGIPGAGGYDALFVLYRKKKKNSSCSNHDSNLVAHDQVRDEIAKFWMVWCDQKEKEGKRGMVCPLTSRYAGYGHGLHSSDLKW